MNRTPISEACGIGLIPLAEWRHRKSLFGCSHKWDKEL